MALEDAITPVSNNEPLHDQPVVDLMVVFCLGSGTSSRPSAFKRGRF